MIEKIILFIIQRVPDNWVIVLNEYSYEELFERNLAFNADELDENFNKQPGKLIALNEFEFLRRRKNK